MDAYKIKDKKYLLPIIIALAIYVLFFVVLLSGIYRRYSNYIVMSGPNWQDTAMHLSIIESLAQGNFPPIAPYFSGQPLSYYYFSDFHSSIVNVMYSRFFPWVLVIMNPFFASTMFLCVYALSFSLTKNRFASIITAVGSLFFGSFGYINHLADLFQGKGGYFELLVNNAYHVNMSSGLQMVPMTDYFLQNRPMMIGLPAVVLVVFLLQLQLRDTKQKYSTRLIVLAGLVSSLLIKFQFFGFVVSCIFFCGYLVELILKRNFSRFIKSSLVFFTPSLILVLLSSFNKAGDRSVVQVVLDSFSWGAWERHPLYWFVNFSIVNLGVPLLLFLVFIPFAVFIKEVGKNVLLPIVVPTLFILAIPFSFKFTIYDYDMFKFFYYSIPFLYVFSIHALFVNDKTKRKHKLLLISFTSVLVVLFSSVTSVNMLIHAFLNKSEGYSLSENNVGLWIRENIPQKSVFITSPTVHSPVSDVAGRLRVLSYINWPYSHGFNRGLDNVFSRDSDIKKLYENSEDQGLVVKIMEKYNADYIYLGSNERSDFPQAKNGLESNGALTKVYDQEDIQIYKRVK